MTSRPSQTPGPPRIFTANPNRGMPVPRLDLSYLRRFLQGAGSAPPATTDQDGQDMESQAGESPASPSDAVVAGEAPSRWLTLERRWPLLRSRMLFPLLLFVVALGLYVPRIAYPDKYVFDEILFAYTAGEYAAGNANAYLWNDPCSVRKSDERCAQVNPDAVRGGRVGKYQWAHPPLGKYFITAGILVFGNDTFGWRFPSALCGAIGIVLAYQLGLALTKRRVIAILAAGLLLVDGLFFVYSRMGLVDIFVTVIMLGALLAFTSYLAAPPDRIQRPLYATGILLGMGISTKWSAGYAAACVGLVVLWRLVRLIRASRRADATPEVRKGVREHLIWIPVTLGVVPAAVYFLAYTPFFIKGGYNLAEFVELQRVILRLQTTIQDSPGSASRWWEWPLALRPVWFGERTFRDGRTATTYANGNPLLYWAFLPSVAWLCFHWWRERNPALIVLVIGFFGQWLPWILVERSAFAYHFLPAVPFGCLAVAMAVARLCEGNTGWRRTLAIEYVVLVALAFAFFYPIYAYFPLDQRALALRMWLPSWPH